MLGHSPNVLVVYGLPRIWQCYDIWQVESIQRRITKRLPGFAHIPIMTADYSRVKCQQLRATASIYIDYTKAFDSVYH